MNTNYIIKAGRTMLSKQFIILNDYIGERSHLPPPPKKKLKKKSFHIGCKWESFTMLIGNNETCLNFLL